MKPISSLPIFIISLALMTACAPKPPSPTLLVDDTSTTIAMGENLLLTYVHAETPAPEGTNPLYKRSAYIHPLRSPGGEILTTIQPPDHIHHYGIWNPWTHTNFGGDSVDFWNLALGQGTVRFKEYLEVTENEGVAGFLVGHDHIYFPEEGGEKVAIKETWDIKVHNLSDSSYIADLTVDLTNVLDMDIELEAYRYGGGLGYRATERWDPGNATVLTSEGKNWSEADGTGARWVRVEGESSVPQGRSGILFLSHPENRSHPEPMRMWPPISNEGKANVFFEFCPIRHQAWILEPGKMYTLKYRMVVFDGSLDAESAEIHWKNFQ